MSGFKARTPASLRRYKAFRDLEERVKELSAQLGERASVQPQQAQKARDPREELGDILKLVEVAFRQAPAWNDPSVKAKRAALPPDPFSVFGTIAAEPLSEEARLRKWMPMAEALALNAKLYGASGAEAVALTIEEGPTFEEQRTVKITATEVKA